MSFLCVKWDYNTSSLALSGGLAITPWIALTLASKINPDMRSRHAEYGTQQGFFSMSVL